MSLYTKLLVFLPQGTGNNSNFPMFFLLQKLNSMFMTNLLVFITFQNKYKPELAQQQTQGSQPAPISDDDKKTQ